MILAESGKASLAIFSVSSFSFCSSLTETSKLSYGMYLMHIFWLGLWVTVFKDTLALPTVTAIPCIAVVTFICCFVTTKIISFIPG